MPTVPKNVTLSANADVPKILNTIRAAASSTYQERVPEATQDTIKETGASIMQFQSTQNEFIDALVNRIAFVMITSRMYQNPLRQFKKGVLELGETIEEVFVNIAKAHEFDPAVAEKKVFEREIPDVESVFHKLNYRNFYKVTISNEQLRTAFLSSQGISDLISRIIESLYTAANFDEFLIMKQLIVDAAQKGMMYPIKVPAPTADNAKAIATQFKAISNALEFMSPKYNAMGVLNYSDKSKQVLIIDTQFDAIMDVEVLASAFNMDKAEFMGQRVLIDDFGALTGAVAALVDRDWFMVFEYLQGFKEIYNPEGLYWNYFYHVWKIFSTSPFSTAILFTTDTVAVTGVTVTPTTATVARGGTANFNATVAGTGYVPKSVNWSVQGGTASTIDGNGVVTVGTAETATTLTVTATSTYDNTKAATATITVG